MPYGLEVGQGIREYAYQLVSCECDEIRVYGYQFHPHDGAGLFYSRSINVDSSAGRDVDHRRN